MYGRVLEAAESWLNKPTKRTSTKLRLFWIGGRSGTGKSIALLHVLARLYEIGSRNILWLESNLDLLPAAVRWCRPLFRQQRTVIIGLDDPYGPTNQAIAFSIFSRVNSELLTLQQEGPAMSLPSFICSGPSEQQVRFKQDLADLVDVTNTELPLESRAELQELWKWFCIRSGKNLRIPYKENEDVLLVQLFFEWRTGEPLLEFATRFKGRIEAMEGTRNGALCSFLARLIALNRIYVGYPPACLQAIRSQVQFEVGFRRLKEEEHHLRIDDVDEHCGVWFAHPHLANAIYNAWFDATEDEPTRLDHLKQAVLESLKLGGRFQDRTAALWAIARLFHPGTDEDLKQRLPAHTASRLLGDVYRWLKAQFLDAIPMWLLPVWVQIQALAPNINLAPSPLQEAVRVLAPARVNEPGMKLLCHKLIEHCERFSGIAPDLPVKISDFLMQSQEWRDWPFLVRAFCVRTRRSDLVPAVEHWLRLNPGHSFASSLLEAALLVSHQRGIIVAGYEWLTRTRFDVPTWSFAWEHLYYSSSGNEKFISLGQRWLAQVNPNTEGWGFVWQRLHRDLAGDVQLIQQAYEWLQRADPRHKEWAFVWQDLYKGRPHDPALPRIGRQWLTETQENHESWGYVWQDLHKSDPADESLIDMGKRWLDIAKPEVGSWSFVWEDLHKNQPEDIQLLERGRIWLDQIPPEHKAWAYVWQKLSNSRPEGSGIFERGLLWLDQVEPEHPSWSAVWKRLLELKPGNEQVLDKGRQWLNRVERDNASWRFVRAKVGATPASHKSARPPYTVEQRRQWLNQAPPGDLFWGFVWQELRCSLPADTELILKGLQWLDEVRPTHPSWSYVWRRLRKDLPANQRLLDQGRRWLDQVPASHPSWKHVWERLLRASYPRDRQILERGRQWLDEIEPNGQFWRTIWIILRKALPQDDQLLARGRKWLDQVQPSALSSWPAVWQNLHNAFPFDEQLLSRGRQWLDQVNSEHTFWPHVWCDLRKVLPDDEELLRRGWIWIDLANPNHPSWQLIWLNLRNTFPEDEQLLQKGQIWIEQVNPNHASWQVVWLNLRDALPNNSQLLQRGRLWIDQIDLKRASWPLVWLNLHTVSPGDKHLLKKGWSWLDQVPLGRAYLEQVWLKLCAAGPVDEKLLEWGRQWLDGDRLDHLSWPSVWETLYNASPGEEHLLERARQWLARFSPDDPSGASLAAIVHSIDTNRPS